MIPKRFDEVRTNPTTTPKFAKIGFGGIFIFIFILLTNLFYESAPWDYVRAVLDGVLFNYYKYVKVSQRNVIHADLVCVCYKHLWP